MTKVLFILMGTFALGGLIAWSSSQSSDYWGTAWTALAACGGISVAYLALLPLLSSKNVRLARCRGAVQILISRSGVLSIKNIDEFALEIISVEQERFLASPDTSYWVGQGESIDFEIILDSSRGPGTRVVDLLNLGKEVLNNGRSVSKFSNGFGYKISPNELVVVMGSRTHFKPTLERSFVMVKTIVKYRTLGPEDSLSKVWTKTVTHCLVGADVDQLSSIHPRNKWVRNESLIDD